VVISTGVVNTIAGTPLSCGTQDGTGANAQFDYPYGITTDGKSLYVTDSGSCTIRRVAISTGIVNTIAGTQGVCNWKDGTGAGDTQFNSPEGITTDGTYLYVADNGNYAIRMINIASGAVTSVPGYYSAYNNYLQPNGITTDGKSLYITDTGNFYGSNSVDKMDIATGSFSTVWADFGTPEGITTDGADLYVTDDGTSTVYKISLSTGAITTVAGSGSAGYKDGSGTNAQFSSPYGLTTDGKSLYVTDSGNNVIRKIQ
jgi:sugar lactone lactonase YvrE